MNKNPVEYRNEVTGEFYLKHLHKSGLTVLIAPNTYNAASAVYASRFGSVDTDFEIDGKKYTVPDGTAHFLEHKLFETEDGGDAFELFADAGADSNAFTSFSCTAFTLNTTDDFYRALDILLSVVHNPHFTKESVEKERGIIGEELCMYEDSPANRSFFELMRCLYKNNKIRNDIGGTKETIKNITADTLYLCHKAFYQPSNMVLSVSGNIDVNRIIETVDRRVPDQKLGNVKKIYKKEPRRVYKKLSRVKTDVSCPIFNFGIKDSGIMKDHAEMQKKSIALSILFDMLFDQSSEFYCDLYERDLIYGDITTGYSYSDTYAYIAVSGESKKPFTVKKRILEIIRGAMENGVDEEDFEISKKIFYSNFIASLQNSQSYAQELLDFHLSGDDMLEYPAVLSKIKACDALEYLKSVFNENSYAFAVVEPENKGVQNV